MIERATTLAFMAPRRDVAAAEAKASVSASTRSPRTQRRWPMAVSILIAVGASLLMWTGIIWVVSAFLGLFS